MVRPEMAPTTLPAIVAADLLLEPKAGPSPFSTSTGEPIPSPPWVGVTGRFKVLVKRATLEDVSDAEVPKLDFVTIDDEVGDDL